MKEQFRLNLKIGGIIRIERSVDGGKSWSRDIHVSTGDNDSTAKLAVKLLYLLEEFNLVEDYCPYVEVCPVDLARQAVINKCPICWDRFFDKKVDELGK